MPLKPQPVCSVPQETARVARAAYPRGNVYLHMRDVLGSMYTNEDFVDLFPQEGQPAGKLTEGWTDFAGHPTGCATSCKRVSNKAREKAG